MARAKNENTRRSTPKGAPVPEPPVTTQQTEIVDSHLGLTPTTRRDDATDVTDVIGPDRDDLSLGTGPAGLPPDARADVEGGGTRYEVIAEESDLTTSPHAVGGDDTDDNLPEVEPDLTDQDLLTNPMAAMGAPDGSDDPAADGNEVYVPPTDPVITSDAPGGAGVLGGFRTTAAEEITPARSASDGRIGDEAIADAVRDALRTDATTTDLQIRVAVRDGIVHLRGTVADLDDAENAEAVTRRVEGIVDVIEELEVTEV